MTDTASSAGMRSGARGSAPEPTGWVGWIVFAGTMMVMVGVFQFIQGLVAVFDDGYYLVADSGLTVEIDYTQWGWTHMIIGTLVFLAGLGLFSGAMWARVVGVALAGLSAIANFAFIAAYPFWSTIVIALDVLVILAITVHGREMKSY